MTKKREEPLVSIIIPTKNSEKTLPYCLRSIQNQTYKNIEVIVVDNNSTDSTREVAKKYNVKVFIYGPERSSQKNYGATMSKGKYLYFVDSDFILHRNVVEECINLVKSGKNAIIVTNLSDPRISLISKIRYYERLSYYGSDVYEAARFISKDLFLKVGGFDEILYANEDYDLHNRLVSSGAKIGRTKKSFEIHIGEPKSLKDVVYKSIYYSRGLQLYFKKSKNTLHLIPIRPSFFSRHFIAYIGRRWLIGIYAIILLKVVQLISSLVGLIIIKFSWCK